MRDLGPHLRAYIDAVAPPVLPGEVATSSHQRRRRHTLLVAAALVAVVTVAVAGFVLVTADNSERRVRVLPTTHTPRPGWHRVATTPEQAAVGGITTGSRVVVAFNGGQLPSALTFAEFDAGSGTWRMLPIAPVRLQTPFSDSPTVVSTGHVLYAVGFEQISRDNTFGGQMRVMAYAPKSKKWRLIADPPIDGLIQTTPIWTGRELLVWGGTTGGVMVPIQGAAYNPRTHHWRSIPSGPVHQRVNESVVWSGKEMIVWGGERAQNDPIGAAYNPTTNRWRLLPKGPISSRAGSAAVWSGHEMLVWSGYAVWQDGPCCDDGAAYNPASNTWRLLPPAPVLGRQQFSSVWTGHAMFVWGGIDFRAGRATVADGALYDPATNTWTVVRLGPLVGRWGAVAVWTGHSVLVVDGFGPSSTGASREPPRTDGATFTP